MSRKIDAIDRMIGFRFSAILGARRERSLKKPSMKTRLRKPDSKKNRASIERSMNGITSEKREIEMK